MVKLRLSRAGKKKKPIYKIVAADSRFARDGRIIEAVGQYNPNVNPIGIIVKEDKVIQWLKNGAQPTDTVRSLLRRKGLWLKWHLVRTGADEAKVSSSLQRWESTQLEKAAREAARKERRKAMRKKTSKEEQPSTPVAA